MLNAGAPRRVEPNAEVRPAEVAGLAGLKAIYARDVEWKDGLHDSLWWA